MTVLSVPYLALLPEMAIDYDERTSLNTYRTMAAVVGTLVAAGMKAVTDWLGGGAAAWQRAALIFAVWIALPWLVVFAVSFERPNFARPSRVGFFASTRQLLATARIASRRVLHLRPHRRRHDRRDVPALLPLLDRPRGGFHHDALRVPAVVVIVAQPSGCTSRGAPTSARRSSPGRSGGSRSKSSSSWSSRVGRARRSSRSLHSRRSATQSPI